MVSTLQQVFSPCSNFRLKAIKITMGRKRNGSESEPTPRQRKKTTLVEAEIESLDGEDIARFICSYCDQSFATSTSLNSHVHDWHTLEGVINTPDSAVAVRRHDDGMFQCLSCHYSCHTKSGIRKHLLDNKNVSCLEQAEENSRKNTLNETLVISSIKSPTVWRSFNDAILHASNESSSSHMSQQKAIAFAERLRQYPIGLSSGYN